MSTTNFSCTLQALGTGTFVLSGDISATARLQAGGAYYTLTGDIIGTLTLFGDGHAELSGTISGLFSGAIAATIRTFGMGNATIEGTVGSDTLSAAVATFGYNQAAVVGSVESSGVTLPIIDNFPTDGTLAHTESPALSYLAQRRSPGDPPVTWTVSGGELSIPGLTGDANSFNTFDSTFSDGYAFQALITPDSGNYSAPGLVVRFDDPQNYIAFYIGYQDATHVYWSAYALSGSDFPFNVFSDTPFPVAGAVLVRVEVLGTQIAFKLNGTIVYIADTALFQSNTRVGYDDGASSVSGIWQQARMEAFAGPIPPVISSTTPTTGSSGSTTGVTIAGFGFKNGATAKVGTADLIGVAFVDSYTLTATVPAGITAGTYNVTVTNPDTQTGTLSNGYTVTIPPDGFDYFRRGEPLAFLGVNGKRSGIDAFDYFRRGEPIGVK